MADDVKPAVLSNMPWWVQAVGIIGTPMLILAFYLAQDAGYVNNPVATRLDQVEGNQEELKGLSLRHEQTSREMVETMKADAQRRQKRCVIRAKTDQEKEACFN